MRYTSFRALLRAWIALAFRKLRVLQLERMPDGPVVLLMAGRVRLVDCLMVVAALEERIQCLIQAELVKGVVPRLLAWGLEMVVDDSGTGEFPAARRRCLEALSLQSTVLVGGNPTGSGSAPPFAAATLAANLALDAEAANRGGLGVAVVPVHVLRPSARRGDALVHLGDPLFAEDYGGGPGEPAAEQVSRLQAALGARCQQNPFSLRPDALEHCRADIERLLRQDLEEQWAGRSGWKQTVDDFRLSGFIQDWCEDTNILEPAVLAGLRQALETYRERRRCRSLMEIQDAGGHRWSSRLHRRLAALEKPLGFPVALYGLVNHLVAALVLWAGGLLRNPNRQEALTPWLARMAVVLAGYAGQIAWVAHSLGRAAAGYYAPTLPLSGLYLWRYVRLARRGVFSHAMPWFRGRNLRRMRQELLARLNEHRDAYAAWLGIPH